MRENNLKITQGEFDQEIYQLKTQKGNLKSEINNNLSSSLLHAC